MTSNKAIIGLFYVMRLSNFTSLLAAVFCITYVNICGALVTNVVNTTDGPIKGNLNSTVISYLGVPYAQPPVDELRFKAPQPPIPRGKLLEATSFGNVCPQRQTRASGPMSEDCLTLNIWVPNQLTKSAPVAVWIHGGGFTAGSGQEAIQQHRTFTDNDIIFVTLNYRLGALGFMQVPDQALANRGFADMIAALGWLQNNIAAFGGDPSQVTIMGESAGGMAVQSLMTAPDAAGLFNQAIAQSGYATWPLPNKITAQDQAKAIIDQAGGLDAAADKFVDAIKGFHLPSIDDTTLLDQPSTLFAKGQSHPVTYLTGANSLDGSVFQHSGVTTEQFTAMIGESIKPLIGNHMQQGLPLEVSFAKLFGEARYLLASDITAQSQSKAAPTYQYYFDYVPDGYRDNWLGAPHASELPLLFNQGSQHYPDIGLTSKTGKQLRNYWVSFIKTGNPNGNNSVTWPQVDSQGLWLVFNDDQVVVSPAVSNSLTTLKDVWPTLGANQ